jgi:hypothetical protein
VFCYWDSITSFELKKIHTSLNPGLQRELNKAFAKPIYPRETHRLAAQPARAPFTPLPIAAATNDSKTKNLCFIHKFTQPSQTYY